MTYMVKFLTVTLSSLYFLTLVVCSSTSQAQTDSISLEQAIGMALTKNQTVSISDVEVRQSESHLREVQSTKLPYIFLRSHYLYAPENGYNEIVTNGGEYGLQMTTGIPLYDGGIRSATIHQAANAIDRSTTQLQKTKTDLTFDVRSAYYEILRAESELRIRDETVQRLGDYLSFIAQLQEGGSGNAGDVMKARVEFNTSVIDQQNSRQAVRKAKMVLNKLIGNAIDSDIEIASTNTTDTSSILQFSIDDNPSVKVLNHDKLSADDDLTIAKGERLPTLAIAGDVGLLGVHPSEYRNNFGYSVFLSLDLPLWSWGGINNRIQQKELSREHLDREIDVQKRDLELQWNTTISDIQYSRSALASYSRNIDEAEKNYLLAKSLFAGGSGSNLEVLDAQRLIVEIKLDYNNALFQLNSSLATALKLSGK